MKKFAMTILMFLILGSTAQANAYLGNYTSSELPSNDQQDQYEVAAGKKLQRGLENFFLGWLEIPHGVKTAYHERKQEYLAPGIETFFIGVFRGFGNGIKRTAVGFYEGVTCVYPQGPIIEEMDEWLY